MAATAGSVYNDYGQDHGQLVPIRKVRLGTARFPMRKRAVFL